VVDLREQRLLAEAPIDLIEEWANVKKDRSEVEAWKTDLINRETNLISRESSVDARTKEFFDRDAKLKENENLSNRYLLEAQTAYDKAKDIEAKSEKAKEVVDKEIKSQYALLSEKEQDLENREKTLEIEKVKVSDQKESNEKESLHIVSQQETLRVAWRNIKALSDNKK